MFLWGPTANAETVNYKKFILRKPLTTITIAIATTRRTTTIATAKTTIIITGYKQK